MSASLRTPMFTVLLVLIFGLWGCSDNPVMGPSVRSAENDVPLKSNNSGEASATPTGGEYKTVNLSGTIPDQQPSRREEKTRAVSGMNHSIIDNRVCTRAPGTYWQERVDRQQVVRSVRVENAA